MELNETFQLIGAAVAVLTFGIGIIKYLLDKDKESEKELRIEINRLVEELRREISEIKENYVKSDVHNRHAEAVERQIRDVSTMVSNMSTSINVRLDNLFSALTTAGKAK